MRDFVLIVLLAFTSLPAAWADSRYVIRGDEVYDSQTKLTWARCSVGQEWKNEHCVGNIVYFNFDTAQKQASDGWRVPTRDELVSLIDPNLKKFPVVDTAAFPDMGREPPLVLEQHT